MERLKPRDCEKAIFSVYDAVIFFILLFLATSIISFQMNRRSIDLDQRSYDSKYCQNSRRAFLSATIPEARFISEEGEVIRRDTKVRTLLYEQIHLESEGISRENITYSQAIRSLGNSHFSEYWILHADSPIGDLIIHQHGYLENTDQIRSSLRSDTSSTSFTEESFDGMEITITLYLKR